ncbi:MAG: hypothetical protein GY719_19045 [bacterium]|nr:hypothetical protein [bacterium]
MIRSLVISFLRSSFKEDMRHQLDGSATAGTAGAPSKKRANPILETIARLGGKLIGPRTKTRIQGYLINKFDVPLSFVPPDQLVVFFEKAVGRLSETVGPENVGDYLEFGVYQGNSMMAMQEAVRRVGIDRVRFFGFDSFEGLPSEAEWDGPWSEGEFRSDIEFTRKRLTEGGVDWDRTELVKGFFSDTLTLELRQQHSLEKASLIMVDADLYTSSRDALVFCEPLIKDTSVIFFDDWNSTDEEGGEKRAMRELLEAHPDLEAEEIGTYSPNALSFLVTRKPAA